MAIESDPDRLPRRGLSNVLLKAHEVDSRVGIGSNELAGAVGRLIVDDEKAKVRIALIEDAFDRGREEGLSVEDGHQDGDWRRHGCWGTVTRI